MTDYSTLEFHDDVVAAVERLPPFPRSVIRLTRVAVDPRAGHGDVASIVKDDLALTTTVVREANSAASASRSRVDTVRAAVTRLGMARVVAISVATSLRGTIVGPLTGYGLDAEEFWRRSQAASYVAESVGSLTGGTLGGGFVTATLLHDIGKVVLAGHFQPDVLAAAAADLQDEAAAERALIFLDHASVGAFLCTHWNLPDEISAAIGGHHLLDGGEAFMAHAVHVADVVTHELLPRGSEPMAPDLAKYESSLDRLGIDGAELLDHAVNRLRIAGIECEPAGLLPS